MNEVRTKKPFRLTAPRAFVPKEMDDQISIFDEARWRQKQDPRWGLLFATLNGVKLPIGLAKKMKRAGNRAGVPDLILPVVQTDDYFMVKCPGLFIELKREKRGVVSDAQKAFQAALVEEGYKVCVARGAREAIEIITEYLAQK